MFNLIDKLNKAIQDIEDGYFGIEKGESRDGQFHLTLSLYKEKHGEIVGAPRQWNIICEEVRESNIRFQSFFFFLNLLDDHPVLFKYKKPLFMITGPEQIYQDPQIYGSLFIEMQTLASPFDAKEFMNEFMPDPAFFSGVQVHLCSGSQEIVDIYTKVLASRDVQVTATPHHFSSRHSGNEQILAFGKSSYVIAEKFHVTEIEQ
jgi:hypothetical protein